MSARKSGLRFRIKLGRQLKELRESREHTLQEVADQFGYNKSTVSKWEKGVSLIDFQSLVELLHYYNATMSINGLNIKIEEGDK